MTQQKPTANTEAANKGMLIDTNENFFGMNSENAEHFQSPEENTQIQKIKPKSRIRAKELKQ